MVGSPYAFTGLYDNKNNPILCFTPMDFFQFSLNGYNWLTFGQAQTAGWLPYYAAYIFDCESQSYILLQPDDWADPGHGFWLRANQNLWMRIQRPSSVWPYPTNSSAVAPIGPITSGEPAPDGSAPLPY